MESKNSNTADRELIVSRLLNAPVELVWEMWTKPEHISQWWGPEGFTNTITKMEMRPGGAWNLVMHGPDGTDYDNQSFFREVIPMKKIVYEHVSPHIIATITFEAQGDKTLLLWHMLFDSRADLLEVVRVHKADVGLRQNVEKLERFLEKQHA